MATLSARQFNQDVSAAKRAAHDGPVTVTDRGEPAYVLLTIDDYRRLQRSNTEFLSRLRMDEEIDVDFPPLSIELRVPQL